LNEEDPECDREEEEEEEEESLGGEQGGCVQTVRKES